MIKTKHENYNKHAKDPFVVFLMGMYLNQKGTGDTDIPTVWLEFAKASTPNSSIDMMLAQFGKWGVNEADLDINLRGQELFEALNSFGIIRLFRHADILFQAKTISWPEALERVMVQAKVIPSETDVDAMRLAATNLRVNLCYEERGTLEYHVKRSIPNVPVRIPHQWIEENCKTEFSDAEIWDRWNSGLQNCFQVGEAKKEARGFEFRSWLKKVLVDCPTGRFDATKLTSKIKDAFPQRVSSAVLEDETRFTVNISNPQVKEPATDVEVDQRNVQFRSRRSRRGEGRLTDLHFPVFSPQATAALSQKGIRVPQSRVVGSMKLGLAEAYPPGADGNADTNRNLLIRTLRDIYRQSTLPAEYAKQKANALNG